MRREREVGFTMVELMVVLAIVAVLAAIIIPNVLSAKLATNEASAIASLRTLVSAQAQVQGIAKIDVDADGIGEFGTFLELTGYTGIRMEEIDPLGRRSGGATFATQGPPIDPPPLGASLSDIETTGFMLKSGYALMILLPDTSPRVRWVNEELRVRVRRRGTTERVLLRGNSGGRNQIGIDMSESVWCAYAQPQVRGTSGNRTFFVDQRGDILQSANDVAMHQGTASAINANSAYRGVGMTSEVAVGTRGNDGDLWRITN